MFDPQQLLDRILRNRLLTHILFWVALTATNVALQGLNNGQWRANFIHGMFVLPFQIGAAYWLVYFQIPRYWDTKRYGLFFGSLLLSALFFGYLARIATIYGAEPFTRENFVQESILEILMEPLYLFFSYIPIIYMYCLWLLVARTVKDRFEVRHQLEVLKKEKLHTELSLLKAQIHPHFLFNTLNNLYALTLNKSDLAPEVVAKLSDLLSYMLYECNTPRVSLQKELTLLQNYVDLERLRYGEELDFSFETEVDNPNAPIAPLLLISLVENAFKHGASKQLEHPLIHIHLSLAGEQFRFAVKNSLPPDYSAGNTENQGLGLANLRRQLELAYPGRYTLEQSVSGSTFLSVLTLEL